MVDLIQKGNEFGFDSWSEHIKSWHNGEHGKFILLRYEDLIKNTEKEIDKLLKFIDFEVSNEVLKSAVENSKFDKLKILEKSKGVVYQEKLKDRKSKFFRKGISGDWKTSFSQKDLEQFFSIHHEAMKICKYD